MADGTLGSDTVVIVVLLDELLRPLVVVRGPRKGLLPFCVDVDKQST